MPLSDHEQRVLEQMEQALYAEDPRFASNLKSNRGGTATRRRAVVGTLLVIAGLGLVILAVTQQMIWLGGLGFGAMVLGGALIFSPRPQGAQLGAVQPDGTVSPGGSTAVKGVVPKKGRSSEKSSGSFMQRMEQRWEKRRDDGPR
ncbi:MAG: DUF3040 domain-containing protein [Ornithinimicrobium sp.]|uniref:DUF3040 domain-containing protein n=1 Tax=Ornithinimicrobium sp. TaxID=1977084 RepID=UPI003D9BC939